MKKRKKYVLKLATIALIATIMVPVVNSDETVLTTLEYKDSDVVFIQGNINLSFNSSDTGKEDTSLLWRIYNSDNNITIFYIVSTTISYDSSFVNDTKSYYYNRENASNETYVVSVDYSSIQVPTSIEVKLNETIEQQNQTIQALKDTIENLQNNISNLVNDYNILKEKENDLKNQIVTLTKQRDDAIAENKPLKAEIDNLEEQLSFQQNKSKELTDEIRYKESLVNSLEKSVKQLRNPWSTGYEYHGKNQGLYFNYSSVIIGIIIGLVLFIGIEKVLGYKGIKIKWGKKKAFGSFQSPKKISDFNANPDDEMAITDPEGLKKLREAEREINEPEKTEESDGAKENEKPSEKPSDKNKKKNSLTHRDIEKEVDDIISNHVKKHEMDYIR